MNRSKKRTIYFAVPQEVHLLDISGPIHVFYEAKALNADIDLKFITLSNQKEQMSSAGIFLSDLEHFSNFELKEFDILFIPGLEAKLIFNDDFDRQNNNFYIWLKQQHAFGAKICSVCTGAYVLAKSGLLNNRECTTHWKYLNDFKKRFPDAQLHDDRLFVKDENLYSSAGVSSGIDLALYILEEMYGPVFTSNVAKEIVVYMRRGENDPQLSVFLKYRNHIENRVHQVQDYLAQNLEKKSKIEELAKLVHMSPRNLTRLFKKTTEITIGEYIDQLRVERSSQLLAEGHKVDNVSKLCGLTSNQLRNLLRKTGD